MRSPYFQAQLQQSLTASGGNILGMLPLLLIFTTLGFSIRSAVAYGALFPTSERALDRSIWEGAIAQTFNPPDTRGMPGRREGGGTRGGLLISGQPPIALIPASNLGTTLSSRPTFFFYIPIEAAGLDTEFTLLDDQGNVLYQAIATLPNQAGIIRFELPDTVALEPGRDYEWFFSVVINPDDASNNITLSGWVQHISNPSLVQQVAGASPSERPVLYAESGIWYDALITLAEQRDANPSDTSVQAQWVTLLESVGLGAIANQPLLGDLSISVGEQLPIASTPAPLALTPPAPASPAILPSSSTESPTLQTDEPSHLAEQPPITRSAEDPTATLQMPEGRRISGFYAPPDPQVPPGRLNFRGPPSRAGSRAGGFARGLIAPASFRMIPLTPDNSSDRINRVGSGITLSNTPLFFIYFSSEAAGLGGELTLWSEDTTELLYEARVTLPNQEGVVSIALPPSINLEPGQTYYWSFEVIFNEDERSRNPFTEGVVQRRVANLALAQQIAATPPLEQPALYAELGVWYDALSTLAELRWADPHNEDLREQWVTLLEAVGLGDIADQPLLAPLAIQPVSIQDSSSEAVPMPSGASFSPSPSLTLESTAGSGLHNPPDRILPAGREGGGRR